ncbi:MAG: hypothetical protein AM1032_000032 [Mycoplasmataceae bacterium]|nr:MAG: hypothetical protein AM1032_000032 [Mycoplasmataceae bacterium]
MQKIRDDDGFVIFTIKSQYKCIIRFNLFNIKLRDK